MSSWLERWRQRQCELAQGSDADLVRDNRNRYRLAFGLMGFGFLLSLLDTKVKIPNTFRLIVVGIATVSLITGFLLALWATQMGAFLRKPDPEEPPRMIKP
jgi:hypothetical protein